jgi:hypothetical protein
LLGPAARGGGDPADIREGWLAGSGIDAIPGIDDDDLKRGSVGAEGGQGALELFT